VQIALREWYKDEAVRDEVRPPADQAGDDAAAVPHAGMMCMACGPVDPGESCVLMNSAIATFERFGMANGLKQLGPTFTSDLAVVIAHVFAQDGFHCSLQSLQLLHKFCPGMDVAMALQIHFFCSPCTALLRLDTPEFCVLCGQNTPMHCVHAARISP